MRFYEDLIDYFFSTDLRFRTIGIKKEKIRNDEFNQNFDDFYYKMYYYLLNHNLNSLYTYNVYLDIKDTLSAIKVRRLKKILNTEFGTFRNVQNIRSHESLILQLTDLIIGAISYYHFNLLKKYNDLLEWGEYNEYERQRSLRGVFDRDFVHASSVTFKQKKVQPTPKDGEIPMDTLFTHLTTVITDKSTRKRTFDPNRSRRLHWVKFHLGEQKPDKMLHFSVEESKGIRTYIYDITEKYVIVLEPLRKVNEYYLLTAYYLKGKDAKRNKILRKYKRTLKELY